MSELARTAVAIRTLGCKVNRAESEAIASALLGGGARIVAEDAADVVVVNTCTVTGEADSKARKAVRQALAAEREPVVVVTGCLAALDRGALAGLGERVVVEPEKERVAQVVTKLLGRREPGISVSPDPVACLPADAASMSRVGDAFRTRAALKVQDGCDAFCAYCIVPYARGLPRAVSLADVLARASAFVAEGVREIVLTGVNIGRYSDAVCGADLADVVAAVAGTGVARVRLSSVEPLDLTPRLLSVLADHPGVCAHLHVPLQAGSDSVLAAMGRTYRVAQYAERIAAAREALPGLTLTTDVMAGFPGETDAHAAETLAFCEEMAFAKLHVFRYSPRHGTPAAERADQVPAPDKSARAAALRSLSTRLTAAHTRSRLGQSADVLVERVDAGTNLAAGTTRDYLRVRFSAGEAGEVRIGDLVDVRLASLDGEQVVGERSL